MATRLVEGLTAQRLANTRLLLDADDATTVAKAVTDVDSEVGGLVARSTKVVEIAKRVDGLARQPAQVQRRIVTALLRRSDGLRLAEELDATTLRVVVRQNALDSASGLLERGVSSSRMRRLAEEGIEFSRHLDQLSLVLARRGERTIQGADDVAEILANNKIASLYPSSHTVRAEVVLKGDESQTLKEIDTVVLDGNGRVVGIGETKYPNSFNAYEKATQQLDKGMNIIRQGGKATDDGEFVEIARIETAGGGTIDVSKLDADNIEDTFTAGPADAAYRADYNHQFLATQNELEELFKTYTDIVKNG